LANERETAVLHAHGFQRESFLGFGALLDGTRRHNFVYVDDLTWAQEDAGLRFSFTLPPGSYATVLLREVMKSEPSAE
jgi:tRNA pseudouridine13 synthase